MDRTKVEALFKSRRFWAAVSGLLVVITDGFGFDLSPSQIEQVTMYIAVWIVGDSIKKTE